MQAEGMEGEQQITGYNRKGGDPMASVNKAIILGHLGRDPERRQTPMGTSICNFSVATSESWTDNSGEKQERTEWHRIVAWRGLAEVCGKYLRKGSQIYIEGRIQTRSWEDAEGNKRYATEIIAQNMQMLGSPRTNSQSLGQGFGSNETQPLPPEKDVPF